MNDAQKALEQWLEITGLKKGDKVLVVDGAEQWRALFGLKPVADGFIGSVGRVTTILRGEDVSDDYVGVAVQHIASEKRGHMWHDLPFWCLVKVEDKND